MNEGARSAWGFLTALALAALWASPLHLPLNNPNEGVRVFAVAALVEDGAFYIDGVVRRWGYIDDKAKHEGHLYSSKAPLPSLLAAAAYAAVHPLTGDLPRASLTRVCRFAGDQLPALVLAALLFVRLRRRVVDLQVASLTVGALVVGTGALASMNVLSGHAVASLAVALGLVLATEERPARADLALLGAVCALAVGSEYPAVLAAIVVVTLAVVRQRFSVRPLLWIAAGAAPFSALVAVAHTAMFGAPWRTGYSFLENKGYQALVSPGAFGIGAPRLDAFATSFFSLELGLFVYAPIAVVGVAALVRSRAPRDVRFAVAAIVLAYAFFIAGFRGWRGGWSVGPRYIAEVSGALAVCGALAFDAAVRAGDARARARWLFALAMSAGAGLVTAGLAGAWFPHLPDTLRNPVRELVLPLVLRGFSPDTPLLWLGAPAPVSAVVACLVLLSPFLVAAFISGARAARAPLVALALGAGAACVVVVVGPRTAVDRAGAELRRMFDNFQPDAGNPILAPDPTDPRLLIAVDRGRFAWPQVVKSGCAFAPAVGARPSGRLADVVTRLPPGSVLVVPDRFAPDIADVARATSVLVISASDVQRHGRGGLPCTGEVAWLDHGAPPPPALTQKLGTPRVEPGLWRWQRTASGVAAD